MSELPSVEDFLRIAAKNKLKTIEELEERYRPSTEFFPMNVTEFDTAMDGGVRAGELITVSGRTGEGKTTFTQYLTANFQDQKIPTLWFTYEMDPWYLAQKFRLMERPSGLKSYAPEELVENSIDFITEQVKDAKVVYGCPIVFIDHLHYLIPLESDRNSSLTVGHVVRQLKRLAVEQKVVIFLIAHTKKIYQDEELDLSSIRDSSLIAQESDYVYLVERLREKKKAKKMEATEKGGWTNFSRIGLAKNRRTGNMFNAYFQMENGRYVASTQEAYEYLHTPQPF